MLRTITAISIMAPAVFGLPLVPASQQHSSALLRKRAILSPTGNTILKVVLAVVVSLFVACFAVTLIIKKRQKKEIKYTDSQDMKEENVRRIRQMFGEPDPAPRSEVQSPPPAYAPRDSRESQYGYLQKPAMSAATIGVALASPGVPNNRAADQRGMPEMTASPNFTKM